MSHTRKTKAQLIQELEALQAQVATLEPVQAAFQQIRSAFREFMEWAYNGFVLFDETGTIIEWNDSQEQLTGISSEEALGQKNWDVLFRLGAEETKTPENLEVIKKRTLTLLETGQAPWMKQSLERTIHRPDGEQRVVQSVTFPVPTEEGFQIGVVTHDITRRKYTEEALHESETRLQGILDNATAMIYIKDLQCRYLHINGHCEQILGVSNAKAQGKTPHDVYPKPIADMFQAHHQKVIETGESFEVEEVFHLDGSSLSFLAIHFPLRDAEGKVYASCGISTDITERKRNEEIRRTAEEQLRQAVKAANVGLWDWDIQANSIYYSPEWKKQIGYEDHEIANELSEWQNRVHPEDLNRTLQTIQTFIAAPYPNYQNEFRLRHKDGSYRWILARADVLYDENDKPIRMLGSHIDITERKRAEEELLKYKRIVSITKDLMALTNADYEYQVISNSYLELFGRTREQVIGKTAAALLGEDIFEKELKPRYEQCMQGEVVRFQDWYDIPDRCRRYMDITYHPSYGSQGTVEGVVVSTRDMTELRQAEEALRKSENRLTEAQTIAQIGSFEMHATDGIQYWSRALYDILGFDPDQPPPDFETLTTQIHPDDLPAVRQSIDQAFKDGTKPINHYRYQVPDGLIKHLYSRAQVILDDQGKPEWIIGTTQDITEFKQAERALRENQQYLSRLMSNLPGVVYRMKNNESWSAEFLSGGIQDLAGYQLDDFLVDEKRSPADLIHPDDKEYVWNNTQEALEKHQIFELTYRILTADGQEKWVWERGQGVFGDDGEVQALEGFITDISDLKQTEQALRESEERYRTLAEFTPIAISIMDEQHRHLYVNPAWEQLTGYSREEAKALVSIELVHPDMRQLVSERAAARLRGEAVPSRYELKSQTKDGQTIWLDFGATVITVEGKPAILTTSIDITDRKQAAEALREERDKAQTYLDIVIAIVVAIDSNQQVTLINQQGCKLLGYSEEEIVGKSWFDTFVPETARDQVKAVFDQLVAGEIEPAEYFENAIVNKHGEERLIAWHNTVLRDDDGRIIGTLSSGEDITERKRVEEALRESEKRFRSSFEYSQTGMAVVSVKGEFIDANQRTCDIFGYPRDELLKIDYLSVTYPEDREYSIERFDRMLAGEYDWYSIEKRYVHKDGHVIWGVVSLALIRDADGKPAYATAQLVDITERKQAEQALRESEARYRILVEHSPISIILIQDGRYVFINPTGARILGFSSPEEAIGVVGLDYVAPPYHEMITERMKNTAAGIANPTTVFESRRVDGTTLPFESTSVPVTYQDRPATLVIGQDITKRMQAEQALRHSEIRFRSLVEQTTDAIFCYEYDPPIPINLPIKKQVKRLYRGILAECNDIAARSYGYTKAEEVVGRPLTELFGATSDSLDSFFQVFVEDGHQIVNGEAREILDDGTERWFLNNGHGVVEDGKLLRIWGTYRDITERKRAEQALRESEARYRTLFEQANDAILIENEDDDILDVNQQACELLGYTRDELLSMKVSQLQAPEYRGKEGQVIRAELEQHSGQPFETADVHRDGTLIPVEVTTSLLTGLEDGLALSIVRDITERKQAEEALKRNEATMRSIFRAAPIGMGLTTNRILGWTNEYLQEMTGYSADELAGQSARILYLNQEEYEQVGRDKYEQLKTQPVGTVETRFKHKDGQIIDILLSSSPIDPDDHSAGMVFTALDITERKRIQQAEREQRILAEALANTASVLSGTLDLNEVFDRILDNVGRVVPHDTAHIMLVEDDVCRIIRTRGYEDKQIRQVFRNLRFNVNDTPNLRQMFETHKPVIIDDVRHYPGWIPTPGLEQFHAYIGAPICVGGEALGFLDLFSQELDSFTEQNTERLQAFADQAAIAIQNAQLFEAERRERAMAQTFQNVSAGLNSPVSMIDTLDLIAGSLAEALDYERVALLLTDGDQLSIAAARGINLSDPAQKQNFTYPDITALYLSMASGDPLIISVDQKPGSSESELPIFDPASTRGWIGLPLVVADVVIGYLCVSTGKSIALKARDLEVVKAFAQQAEFVIGNSLILDELAISLTNLHEARERLSRAARLSVAGEIAAGVAHQINNPLTTVVAQVYLLMKKLPPKHPGFKHVESIKQAAYRAGSVVQRMLDFGRPTPFLRQPLDVNQSIKSAISLVRAQIEPHIAQIKVELAPDLPPIKGSTQHLEDVWLNLLLNARDALISKEHGIISVTTGFDTQHKAVTIIIKDNGPGISPEDLARVFDPFFTTKSHGTGLGLAICQDVIVKHNGTISVNSIEGQETSFTISLPV